MREVGVDIHVDPWQACVRCLMDYALYGEALWDLDTLIHLNPNETIDTKDGRYEPSSPPLTVAELLTMVENRGILSQ